MIIILAATTVNVIIDCSHLAQYIVICSIKLNAYVSPALKNKPLGRERPRQSVLLVELNNIVRVMWILKEI